MRSRGFTLVEVLVAFAILALVLGTVFRTLSTGLSHERTAKLATARVLEARSVIDRVGGDLPLEEGTTTGELATGEPWTLTVSLADPETEDRFEARPLHAYLADLRVDGADGRTLHLQTLKLGP
ncbi:MAG TPA: prepilin-type N-terminal cleavage/methylation domain-containing protein [Thermohalobaculum sp.]|nr:prepilin-type N-terminal cleavage/methylation domain-containing protein [Thermohalobaculum sp.]